MFFFHKIEVALALSYDGWLWLTGVRIQMPMNLLMHVLAISCIRWSFKESFPFSGNTPKATYLRACLCFWGNAADNPSIFWWLLFTSDWWTSFSTSITLLKTSSFLNDSKEKQDFFFWEGGAGGSKLHKCALKKNVEHETSQILNYQVQKNAIKIMSLH